MPHLWIFTVFFSLISAYSFSQSDDFCATSSPAIPDPPNIYSKSIDIGYLNNFPSRTFNIFFWRINKNDGTYTQPGYPITLEKVKRGVDSLNHHFAPMNICFNLVGMDTINSTMHHTGSSLGVIRSYAKSKGRFINNAFNVFAPHSLSQGSGQSGYNQTTVAIISAVVGGNSRTFSHEIGHCFNLIHTFGNSNERPDPANCERVTRNVHDPSYNASDKGDRVIDTNAVPNFQREQNNHFAYAVLDAGIVSTWGAGRTMSFRENGFHELPNASAIAQALADYGFTITEINFLRYNPALIDAYSDVPNCKYLPDSRINNPNSPFFKDCGGTPYSVTTSDYRNIMAYSNSTCGRFFTTGQAIRVHEAITANDSLVFNPVTSHKVVDLYVRDMDTDIGQEPNIHTEIFWDSQDIWVRKQNDGILNQQHQNPVYKTSGKNYVYVRVSNKGCSTSSGNDQLKVYWAKGNTLLKWPEYWEGGPVITPPHIIMSDLLGSKTIPPIAPGGNATIMFEWEVPNPQDYVGINPNPWSFSLLARIESNDDPMTLPEGLNIALNVKNNNNIAWKNTTVITVNPNTLAVGGAIAISNPSSSRRSFSLELVGDERESGKPIYQEAEIGIEMDSILFNGWEKGGESGINYGRTANEKRIIATGNNLLLEDVDLAPDEYATAYVSFNFLTKELTDKQNYLYHIIQKDKITNEIIGGATFEIRKQPRVGFYANAGASKEIDRNDSIVLQASDIYESALYNWYGPDGILLHSGQYLTVSPDMTKQYQLEIISDLDGLKDYDAVTITVKPFRIISLTPNPVSSMFTIKYMAQEVNSAYISIVNQATAVTDNFILNTSLDEIGIDITNHSMGLYSVFLVCDGEVQDIKNLIKQ
ncbi:hypothetical protein EI546_12700 [Aequorivita sp. H23M31]|uniref:T9SS type A sorting domain-containing protein n=1 Tax=Aequorivita ciconiae TaxID=2494375 RepID=A0A410G5Q7_9FLAO|nr:hypothetical protein [Aequorivita sp. H23M31]QAA82525.1 hypothetical protein EI546_12700 [Aequorivita sp. H23M31]